MDNVFEFTNISRPAVSLQQFQSFSIDGCVRELGTILAQFAPVRPPAASFLPPVRSGKLDDTASPETTPDEDVE